MTCSQDSQDGLVLCEGDPSQWMVAITRVTMERILKCGYDTPGDMIALWMFYAYTCRWQKTNRVRATVSYVSKGLGWGEVKTRRVKQALRDLGLISDVRVVENGKVDAWYVQVFFLAKASTPLASQEEDHPVKNPQGGTSTVWKSDTQILKDSKSKCSRTLNGNACEAPDGESDTNSSKSTTTETEPIPPSPARPPSQWCPTPLQRQINSWYNRRDSTPWSQKEMKALKAIPEPDDEDLILLAEYVRHSPYRRRDILTLLNNWTGEIDRARGWAQEQTVTTSDSNPLYRSML